MWMPGTYIFNNGTVTFKIIINPSGNWVTLGAPKAMLLEDLFNPDYWTEQT